MCNHDYSFGTIGNFINSALKNHNVTLYGSREYKRTFTHIKEICSLMIKGGFHEQFNGNIYNIGKLPILGYPLLDGRQSAPV